LTQKEANREVKVRINKIFDLIQLKTEEDRFAVQFNNPTDNETIGMFEDEMGIKLPLTYKLFLLKYDGGFICNGSWAEYIWETGNIGLPREKSSLIFSIEEILEEYLYLNSLGFNEHDDNLNNESVAIPFGRTAGGGYFYFRNSNSVNTLSPVYYSCMGADTVPGKKLFDSFCDFMEQYIKNNGKVAL